MNKWNWNRLSSMQIGRYGEYLAKMEMILMGFDVYSAEVDERGIDFVLRTEPDKYYDVQVKTAFKSNYIYFRKSKFCIRPALLVLFIRLVQHQSPSLYLIPSVAWKNPDKILLVERDYPDGNSEPEFGLNVTKKSIKLLEKYQLENSIREIGLPQSSLG